MGGKVASARETRRFTATISGVLHHDGSPATIVWFDRASSAVKLGIEAEWTGEPSEIVVDDLTDAECCVIARCVRPAKVAP
jgi:hypothetical protein